MAARRTVNRPLNREALDRLALRYVERFATTRGKLSDYLRRKIRERGWDGPAADPDDVAARMAALGYVDDRSFAEARARSLTRRGYGSRRVAMALSQARVEGADAEAALSPLREMPLDAALAFARRRRIGPFATAPADRDQRAKHVAALIRAGHAPSLARRIAEAAPGETIEQD